MHGPSNGPLLNAIGGQPMSDTRLPGQFGYVCFYNRQRKEIYADSQYAAQRIAAEAFGVKPKFSYKVSVTLCERADGSNVIQTAS